MTRILIPTIERDIHAAAVALVLKDMGHEPIRWFCSDIPDRGAASYELGAHGAERTHISFGAGSASIGDCDVFWNRRVGEPVPSSQLTDADCAVAHKESTIFLRGLLMNVSRSTFSVNDYEAARSAENKMLQLKAAKQIGLAVPPTLISNDPVAIRAFLDRHAANGCIFKSFKPATWWGAEGAATLFTSRVALRDLPDDAILRQSPGIFQCYVPKAFEVRVTCMGDELVAARLDSQRTQRGLVDWREAHAEGLQVSSYSLPAQVAEVCRALLARLGLVFGCMDFIVTPDGEFVFLEVNQMGQFLWVEQGCPDLELLQMFCDFLLSRDPAFRWRPSGTVRAFADVAAAALELLQLDACLHARPELEHIVRE